MFVKKCGIEYYVFRSTGNNSQGRIGGKTKRNWWLIKWKSTGECGYINFLDKELCIPKELVGKRVRLKLEVIP